MRVFGQFLVGLCLASSAALLSGQTPPAPPAGQAPAPAGQGSMPPPLPARGPAAAPQAPPPSPQSIEAANKILADARGALGGDAKLTAVKSFVATGRTRRVSGENLVPIEFQIDVELPDKYVRKDEIPAQETAPSSSGFNGENLIQIPPPAPPPAAPPAGAPRAGGAPAAPAREGGASAAPAREGGAPGRAGGAPAMSPQQMLEMQRRTRVTTIKQDFARLTLGMFAASFPSYPLTFSHTGQAEAPQGKADVIDVKGAGNFAAKLFVMSDTKLPVMLSWTVPVTPANIVITAPGAPKPANLQPGAIVVEGPAAPAATASKEEQDAYARDVAALRQKTMASARPIEHRLYYLDYRDNDGLKFPFRVRRAIGPDTIEETTFDRFRLNARIDPKRFEPVK
jgi:hypothetical protein